MQKSTIKSTALILAVLMMLTNFFSIPCFAATENYSEESDTDAVKDFVYLSDIEYDTDGTNIGYGSLGIDQNSDGAKIALLLDGTRVEFDKGLGIHATSTVVYDISQYSGTYEKFTVKLGINATQGGKGNAWFEISVSDDKQTWESLYKSDPVTSSSNALEVYTNVSGKKYLKLYVDSNGGNGNDHGVFADARLVKADFVEPDSAITEKGVYLSDLNYAATGTNIGYGVYHKDSNINGTKIQLRLDNTPITFDKGFGAHATSTVTFNISRYSQEFSRFVAIMGVDASQGSKGSVWFKVLASNTLTSWNDNTGWVELLPQTSTVTAANNAIEVDLNVEGYKYLRLYADSNGGNGNDHSVFADARLIKSDYDMDSEYIQIFHKLSWYDTYLSKNDYAYNLEHNTDILLEREFVRRMGFANIQNCIKSSPSLLEALQWLIDDVNALRLFIETGNIPLPTQTLQNLDILFAQFKDILDDSTAGYTYKKMLISLAVTWSNDTVRTPYKFGGTVLNIDITERFKAVKWLYDNEAFYYSREMFETYNMELMRTVMNDYVGTDELMWVQHYGEKKFPNNPEKRTGPYNFMAYVHPPYYARDEYFNAETWSAYDEKYDLTQYNISRSESDNKVYRMWMVYEAGGICWNISRIGQTLNRSYGIPTIGVFQPSHEAYFVYSENSDGKGMWSIGNNVFGWQSSYSSWGGMIYRGLLNWGSGTSENGMAYSNITKNSGAYMILAQDALNSEAALRRSQYINMLADVYSTNAEKLEVYNASLEALSLNLDTYLDIISLYKSMGDDVTEQMWTELSLKIISAYTYHPVPMVDLLNLIEPHLGDSAVIVNLTKINALQRAQKATEADALQWSVVRVFANSMLGLTADDALATFSFDGDMAGCIVINEAYAEFDFQFKYSLDGGETWLDYTKTAEDGRIIRLSAEQIASINAENDILMYLAGMNVQGEEPDYFIIDILESARITSSYVFVDDEEDNLVCKDTATEKIVEYSLDGTNWLPYDRDARFHGAVRVYVRFANHGVYLAGEMNWFTMKADSRPDSFKYIPIENIEFVSCGSFEEGRNPEYAIDANSFTSWHTTFNQNTEDKSYVVSLKGAKYIAGIAYTPDGVNGRIQDVEVYTSLNGTDWNLSGSCAGWANNTAKKELNFTDSVFAKYIKIVALSTYGTTNENVNTYVSGKDFYFYEDTTKVHTEHDISQWIIVTEASCITEGYRYKECTVCKEVLDEESIPMLDHTSDSGVTVPPTEFTEGFTLYTCTECGTDVRTETIPALGAYIQRISPAAGIIDITYNDSKINIVSAAGALSSRFAIRYGTAVASVASDNCLVLDKGSFAYITVSSNASFQVTDTYGNIKEYTVIYTATESIELNLTKVSPTENLQSISVEGKIITAVSKADTTSIKFAVKFDERVTSLTASNAAASVFYSGNFAYITVLKGAESIALTLSDNMGNRTVYTVNVTFIQSDIFKAIHKVSKTEKLEAVALRGGTTITYTAMPNADYIKFAIGFTEDITLVEVTNAEKYVWYPGHWAYITVRKGAENVTVTLYDKAGNACKYTIEGSFENNNEGPEITKASPTANSTAAILNAQAHTITVKRQNALENIKFAIKYNSVKTVKGEGCTVNKFTGFSYITLTAGVTNAKILLTDTAGRTTEYTVYITD